VMIDREQLLNDINKMPYRQRYAHVMSAMHVLFTKPDDSEVKSDALVIARTHLELFNALTKRDTRL